MNRQQTQMLKRSLGLSLIELMVAMVISLVLILGVVQFFLSNRATYDVQQGVSTLQESGLFALQNLHDELSHTGFAGCGNLRDMTINIVSSDPLAAFGMNQAIVGVENEGAGTQYGTINVIAGTDSITVAHAAPQSTRLFKNMDTSGGAPAAEQDVITIPTNINNYAAGQILMIADCQNIDVFTASAVTESNWNGSDTGDGIGPFQITHTTADNNSNNLTKPFQNDAELTSFVSWTYFIGQNAAGGSSLYRLGNHLGAGAAAEELVDGVANMQIQYGRDTTGDRIVNPPYVNADAVADWSQVVSIRLGIVAQSTDNALPANTPVTLALPGGNVNYNDQNVRQSFNTTIAIRSRLP